MVLPKRKHTRLKEYDYSNNGYYFVTICTQDKLPILSKITVGRGFTPAVIKLTKIGKTVQTQLLDLQNRFTNIIIEKYVIMPTHIHFIILISDYETNTKQTASLLTAGVNPRPTLTDIICVFKSMSTRICNQYDNVIGRKIWQSSFYEHVIRNKDDYENIWQYIEDNPKKWEEDRYYCNIL